MTVAELNKKFQALDIQSEALKAIDRTKDTAVQMNRDQLFYSSMRADGSYLQAYKSDFYAEYKDRRNPAPGFGHPDLYETGSFQKRFFAIVKGTDLVFDSSDNKRDKLVNKYGKLIFGLTAKSLNEYATIAVHNDFRKTLKSKVGI